MRTVLAIWKHELTSNFYSPVAYVTMVIFMLFSGTTFIVQALRTEGTSEPLSITLFASTIIWLTVLITVIGMRLFAEEKRSGTLEALLTAPVTEAQVVIGKYAGAMTFLTICLIPVIANIYILVDISPAPGGVDSGSVIGGTLVLLLLSALSMAVGLLVSMTTRNQIIAAIGCFSAIWAVLLVGWIVSALPFVPENVATYISAMAQLEDFARGSIDSRPLILYASTTVFVLYAATRLLESRRWRG